MLCHTPTSTLFPYTTLFRSFGPNDERGIFRTGDGGKTWQRVLFRDRDSGGIDVVLDPRNPNTLFASLRSEEHTSELQSRVDLVCRLLLEKKKRQRPRTTK